jgi:hypothetical protein
MITCPREYWVRRPELCLACRDILISFRPWMNQWRRCRLLYCLFKNKTYSRCPSLGCQEFPCGRKKGLCCLRFANHQHVFVFHHITSALPLQSHTIFSSSTGHDFHIPQGLRSPPIAPDVLLPQYAQLLPSYVWRARSSTLTSCSRISSSLLHQFLTPWTWPRQSL